MAQPTLRRAASHRCRLRAARPPTPRRARRRVLPDAPPHRPLGRPLRRALPAAPPPRRSTRGAAAPATRQPAQPAQPADSWAEGRIHCTAATAAGLALRFPGLRTLLVALEHGQSVALALGPLAERLEARPFAVCAPCASFCPVPTLSRLPRHGQVHCLPSGHCAGSAAFLFEGAACGRVLATGDFRQEAWRTAAALPAALRAAPLDLLLLDNTYCHPSKARRVFDLYLFAREGGGFSSPRPAARTGAGLRRAARLSRAGAPAARGGGGGAADDGGESSRAQYLHRP